MVEDLRRHCLRNVLIEEHGGGGERVSPGELAGELGSEAIVSKTLGAAAARLGDLAAMAAATDTGVDLPAAELSGLLAEAAAHPAALLGEFAEGDLERRAERVLSLL